MNNTFSKDVWDEVVFGFNEEMSVIIDCDNMSIFVDRDSISIST